MTVAPGTRFGRYEVLAPLGAGGMGEVHRARDMTLDREVAVKILSRDLAADPSFAVRFEREAKVVAALSHPSILSIFDFGVEGQTSYLVTELLSGHTLRSLVSGGALPVDRVIALALSVCDGLAAAHEKGIVHRDLKPANIFVTGDGRVKILDFGIAQVVTPRGSRDQATVTLTSGEVKGTPGYMAPEQIRAERARVESDIFSLGCVLHELLTGVAPFERETAAETMTAILREPAPDIRALAPAVPDSVVYVVERCLEKDWRERFRSAHDLALALRAPVPGAKERDTRSRRTPLPVQKALVVAAAAVFVLLGAFAYVKRQPAPPAAADAGASLAVLPFVNATADEKLDYLSEGLTEMIINRLSPLSKLRVLSRNSVLRTRGEADPREASVSLAVKSVVTGRITREGETILVSVALVDGADGHQIWGERYRRTPAEMPRLEEEIAGTISRKLELQLTGRDRERLAPRRQPDPDAYRLYLQGRFEMNKRVPERMRKGMEDFDAAIAADPGFALPHLGLAHAYVLFGGMNEVLRPDQAMPMARAAAKKALELDPSLSEAHAALGAVAQQFEWSWPDAEREFTEAIRLDDRDAIAHQWYGMALSYRGLNEDAMRELKRALELDPMSLIARADVAQVLWMMRRHEESIAAARAVIELEPDFWLGHLLVGLTAAARRDFAVAIPALEKAMALKGSSVAAGGLGWCYAQAGRREDALKIVAKLRQAETQRHIPRTPFVLIGLGLEDFDGVFGLLDEACAQRSSLVTVLPRSFFTDPIRADPRFARYLDADHPCAAVKGTGS